MNHSVSKHVPSFAKGLQILVVDDDRDTLSIITAMLELCSYKVTSTGEVSEALSMIKEQKSKFKLVMASIDMPEMNPYSFLKASLQCGIGVILMSSSINEHLAKEALDKGASLFLMKPLSMAVLKQLWQSVCWKNTKLIVENKNNNNINGKKLHLSSSSSSSQVNNNNINKQKRPTTSLNSDNNDIEQQEEGSKSKRSCLVWTPQLHNKFTKALSLLGDEKAQPKMIREEMGVPHLTRHQIASHLQKYKAGVKRLQDNDTSLLLGKSSSHSTTSTLERMQSSMTYKLPTEDSNMRPRSPTHPNLDFSFNSNHKNKPLSEYFDHDILKILEEEDVEEPKNYGFGPNIEDVNRYCEWLKKSI